MKKLFSVLVVLLLTLSLAACGEKPEEPKNTTDSDDSKLRIAYVVGNLGDKSFSDSGEVGMNTLRKEGYDVKTIETQSDAAKYEDYILDAIDSGYNLILASETYYDVCKKVALENPEVKFVIFDAMRDPEELPENMAVIFYAQNEGSYLVGYMAAAMSQTGTIAVNLGINNPVLADFVTGYANGAKDWSAANGRDTKVIVAEVGSWTDPAKMKTITLDQAANSKADVFYGVAGGSGDGIFEACLETGTWAIGVDSDQYQLFKDSKNPEMADVILTSMLKEVGNSLVAIVHSIANGEDVWKKTQTLGLAVDAVGYVDNEFFQEHVPAEVREAMAEAAAKIKSGELKVKSYFDFANEDEYREYVGLNK